MTPSQNFPCSICHDGLESVLLGCWGCRTSFPDAVKKYVRKIIPSANARTILHRAILGGIAGTAIGFTSLCSSVIADRIYFQKQSDTYVITDSLEGADPWISRELTPNKPSPNQLPQYYFNRARMYGNTLQDCKKLHQILIQHTGLFDDSLKYTVYLSNQFSLRETTITEQLALVESLITPLPPHTQLAKGMLEVHPLAKLSYQILIAVDYASKEKRVRERYLKQPYKTKTKKGDSK